MTDQSHKPFKTPEHYFDSLPDRIIERLPHPDSVHRRRSISKAVLRYGLSAAAVVLIGLFLWQSPAPPMADEQALEEYLAAQNISQYELIEGLSDEQIRALEVSLFQPKNADDEIH